jgi:ABC-type dipeptide/oligopeptide/nickel transport system permease subunit
MSSYIFYLIVYPLLLMLSLYIGMLFAKKAQKKKYEWKPLGMENGLVGFYALLISFSLAQAANHHRERVAYIHETGDKMALLIRKSELYDPVLKERLKPYYSQLFVILLGEIQVSQKEVHQSIDKIEVMDNNLDAYLIEYSKTSPENEHEVNELMGLIEQMEDVYYRLMYSYHENTPHLILFILVVFSLLIGVLMGFINKIHHNQVHISAVIFIIISFLITNTIHDLDTPSLGFIKPNFEDIRDVKESFELYFNKR